MNPKQFWHTFTAWGGQPTKSRLRRGQISVDPSAPWDGQGDINQYDFPHASRSDCRIIASPQQLLTNAPISRPRAFSLPWQWRRRWQSGMEEVGEARKRAARGSHQKLPGALGHFGPGVHWSRGSLNLRQGSYTTSIHFSEIFLQAINYYTSTSRPGSGEPFERGCKNQSGFTTFTLAEPQLFISVARNLKMPYLSQWHR